MRIVASIGCRIGTSISEFAHRDHEFLRICLNADLLFRCPGPHFWSGNDSSCNQLLIAGQRPVEYLATSVTVWSVMPDRYPHRF